MEHSGVGICPSEHSGVGIFPSPGTSCCWGNLEFIANSFPAQGGWRQGGDRSAKTTWIQGKTNNSLSSSWLPKSVPGFLEAQLLGLVPGSSSRCFVTGTAPVVARLEGWFPAALLPAGDATCPLGTATCPPGTARPQSDRHTGAHSPCTATGVPVWVTN